MKASLILGSNLGDRASALASALSLLEERLGPCTACSPVVETEAVGFDGPAFLNQILCFECSLSPEALLEVCKDVEKAMGRDLSLPLYDAQGSRIYRSRIMDIDILLYGTIELCTAELVIPHPQLESRPYVRALLGLVHPTRSI